MTEEPASSSERGGDAADSIPSPPWRSAPAQVRRREPLTRDLIVETALQVLDQVGLDRLSMRRVAEALDTGASSLYAHVRNKDELLELVFDRVAGEMELPEPDLDRWRDQFKDVMRQARQLMLQHRDIARISMGRIPIGPNAMRWTEWILRLLKGAGFPDQVAAYAGDLLGLYVGAYALEESQGLASPTGEDMPPEQILDMVRGYFASLPADRFPNITSMVDVLMAGDQNERFEFGLEVLIAGLDVAAQRTSDVEA